jgi:hypothetical protein
MSEWLREHWRAFWCAGPENLYTFVWWSIFGSCAAAVFAAGSHLLGLASKWEDRFVSVFVALLLVSLATWITRRRMLLRGKGVSSTGHEGFPGPSAEAGPKVEATRESNIKTDSSHRPGAEPLSSSDPPEAAIAAYIPWPSSGQQAAPSSAAVSAVVGPMRQRWEYDEYEPSAEDLDIVYESDAKRGLVKLRFLSDRATKNDDALFLVLYGYKLLLNMTDVPVRGLNQSLTESGCRKELSDLEGALALADRRLDVDRLAELNVVNGLLQKHSLSKGGLYRLTETGLGKAKNLFIYMRDRA